MEPKPMELVMAILTLGAIVAAIAVPYIQTHVQEKKARHAAVKRLRLGLAAAIEYCNAVIDDGAESSQGMYLIRQSQFMALGATLRSVQIDVLDKEWAIQAMVLQGHVAMIGDALGRIENANWVAGEASGVKAIVRQVLNHLKAFDETFRAPVAGVDP